MTDYVLKPETGKYEVRGSGAGFKTTMIRGVAAPTAWREQYDRMRRWHERLALGVEHVVGRSDEATLDSFYAFAQTCYHLVDWLENDHSQHVRRADAERYVENSAVLAFCRDICNGSKHAQLRAKKVDVRTEKTTTAHSIQDDEGQTYRYEVADVQVSIRRGDDFIEAANFAGHCIEEWDRFLEGVGLL